MEGKRLVKQQSKDPFEAAFDEEDDEDSPPHSPPAAAVPSANPATLSSAAEMEYDDDYDEDPSDEARLKAPPSTASDNPPPSSPAETQSFLPARADHVAASASAKARDDDDEEEEENMDVELDKLASTGDPDKSAKMQAILSQFSEEQMSRYESFRRAGFQRANMKRLLASITGTQKISIPMTIVVSGIAKMFVGELVETARMVMSERKESGPIRPCHIREAYRRLKIEGKVPKRSVPRLFR